MKLWAMSCRATQDRLVMVESSDKMWSTGEGNGKPLQYSCLENPMNSMKRQKDMTLKDELPKTVGAQYATGEEWRNNSRKNEETEPKWKQCPVVDVTGDGSKVRCCKEQHCIGTWNVTSMNQGKLEVVKVQPLWRRVWGFLKKLEIELPYDPAIPLLGMHTKKTSSAFKGKFPFLLCFMLTRNIPLLHLVV